MGYDVFISYNQADKLIAEAACHFLEERRLRCFIASRDLKNDNWAGFLYNTIESAKAFVLILSAGSISSVEVAKETALATRFCEFIFPFRIDDTELDESMRYHLAPYNWIDAMTPPLEERLNELADRVVANLTGQLPQLQLGNLSNHRNKDVYRLLWKVTAPRAEFIGRDALLEELHQLLQQTNAVFLTGMGGIGKSEIARTYAYAHKAQYPVAVFATYETDLLHLITSDEAIQVVNLQQAAASGGQSESTESYFQRKMKVLRSIVNENTLLIIDNFDVEFDDRLEEVLQLPCKQIWTTRTDFSPYGYTTLPVGPIEDIEDLVTLVGRIDRLHTSQEDQAAIRDIIRLLDRHTFAVSLTAAQMKEGRIKPQKMLQLLQTQGLNINARSTFAHIPGQRRTTAYGFIRALFDFSQLDSFACRILRYMACMPREGVDIDLFMECCDIDDFGDISRLIELHWIQLDKGNDRISLHMLVKELVWEQLTPTEESCAPLLEGAYRWANNAWNKRHEENKLHSGIIFALLEAFPTPPIQWLDAFEDMATFAWILGRFDLSERCEHYLYSLCADHYGALSVQAGNQALRVAAVYYNQGNYAAARPWYEKGLAVQEAIDPNSLDTYAARQKVARSDGQLGRYEIALAALLKNLDIVQFYFDHNTYTGEALRKMHIRLAASQQYVAQLLACMGRFQEALSYARKAREYFASDTVEPSLIIYIDGVLAYIHQGMGEYAQAIAYTEGCMHNTLHYHGADRIDMMLYLENMGDLLAKQEDFTEAASKYATALRQREKLYPADTAAIDRLEEKLACVQQGKAADLPFLIMWP